MGTYKPASRKFDGCLPCNENYTTNGTGALEEAECNIRMYQHIRFCKQCMWLRVEPFLKTSWQNEILLLTVYPTNPCFPGPEENIVRKRESFIPLH